MADLQNRISQVTSENSDFEFEIFKAILKEAIQKHVPTKQRYVQIKLLSLRFNGRAFIV